MLRRLQSWFSAVWLASLWCV